MVFGWAFLLLIPIALLVGPVVGVGVWLLTRGRPGSLPLTLTSAAMPLVFLLTLGFAFFSPWILSEGKDWDTGSFDVYRTPLGGGFFVTSIDSFYETGFLEASDRSALAPGTPEEVTRLGCWNGTTFLSLADGKSYAVVRTGERRLELLPDKPSLAAILELPAGQALPWINRSGFSSTPCSPEAPPLVSTLNTGVWLGLPSLVLAAGLGLILWFVRVRRSPAMSSPPRNEW